MFLKKRTILIIAAILLVLTAGLLAILLPGSGKTAREAYLAAEGKNIKKFTAQIKNTVSNIRDNVAVYNNEPYKRRTELTAGIESGDKNPFGLKNAQEFFDVIAKCKLVTDTRTSPLEKKTISQVSLLFDKSPFLDAEIFNDSSSLTFTVPEILPERYFGMDRNMLNQVYERFGIPVRPERIVSFKDIVNTIDFKDELLDKSIDAYGTFISGMITEDNVKYGNDIILDVAGEKTSCHEIIVSFNAVQTKQLLQGLSEKLAADDSLMGMTFGNAAGISQLIREARFFDLLDFLEKSGFVVFNDTEKKMLRGINIENNTEDFKNKLGILLKELEFPNGIKIKQEAYSIGK